MAKLEIKAIIKHVGEVETFTNYFKQRIIVMVPGYVDQFGDKKGKDEYWPVDIFGDKIDRYNLRPSHVNEKADVKLFVAGSRFEKKDGTGVGYAINCNLDSITLLGQSTAPVEEDDLPF
jgi:hypothetical protein